MTKSFPLPYFLGDTDILPSVPKKSNGNVQQLMCWELQEPSVERGSELFYKDVKGLICSEISPRSSI